MLCERQGLLERAVICILIFLFLQSTKQTIDQHIAEDFESYLEMMNHSSHKCNEKSTQMEEKKSKKNQAEVLAAARQNIQPQQTKLSHVENSIIEQKRTTEKLLADLKVLRHLEVKGMLSLLRWKK